MFLACFEPETMSVEFLEQKMPLISEERRAKIEMLAHYDDKKRSLCAYMLLCRALGQESVVLSTEPGGKPYLSGGPYISLSHTRGAVCCAVSESPVGVDCEYIRKIPRRLSAKIFTDDERARLTVSEEPEREFTMLWTMKESLGKAKGVGVWGDKPDIQQCGGVWTAGDYVFSMEERGGLVFCACGHEIFKLTEITLNDLK